MKKRFEDFLKLKKKLWGLQTPHWVVYKIVYDINSNLCKHDIWKKWVGQLHSTCFLTIYVAESKSWNRITHHPYRLDCLKNNKFLLLFSLRVKRVILTWPNQDDRMNTTESWQWQTLFIKNDQTSNDYIAGNGSF